MGQRWTRARVPRSETLNNLAGVYRDQHKYADAERLLKRALAILEKTLGNRAITKARKAGATLKSIGDVLGISKEWVRQIAEGTTQTGGRRS